MRQRFTKQVITAVATLGSLVAFFLLGWTPENDIPAWRWILLVIAVLAFGINIRGDWLAYKAESAKIYQSGREIRDYMTSLLERGGRCAIFSRDLTWADHSDVRDLLNRKARRGELTLVLPKPTPLATELAAQGASLFTYPDLNCELRSRFTLVQLGTAAPSVAVGRPQGETVLVEEFDERTHPVVTLAEDLRTVLEQISTRQATIPPSGS
ncbi:hypothetical protein [Microlunatus spumicola]